MQLGVSDFPMHAGADPGTVAVMHDSTVSCVGRPQRALGARHVAIAELSGA